MPTPFCFSSVRLERVRIAQLDPTTLQASATANTGYVIDSQVLLTVGTEIEAGEEFTQKNSGGRLCASLKENDLFKRVTLSLQVCNLDPVLESMLTGARLFNASGVPVGAQAPASNAALTAAVCLEGWSRAWDGTQQAIPAVTSPNVAYHHWVFPYAHGFTVQDFDLNNGIHLFQYNGSGDENSAITLNGPFNDWPSSIADEGGVVGAYGHFFDSAIPSATCTRITPSAAS
jgi:hypothetical protein